MATEEMEITPDLGPSPTMEDIDIDIDFVAGPPDEDLDLGDAGPDDVQQFISDTRDEMMAEGDDVSYGMADADDVTYNDSATNANDYDYDIDLGGADDNMWQQSADGIEHIEHHAQYSAEEEMAVEAPRDQDMGVEAEDYAAVDLANAATLDNSGSIEGIGGIESAGAIERPVSQDIGGTLEIDPSEQLVEATLQGEENQSSGDAGYAGDFGDARDAGDEQHEVENAVSVQEPPVTAPGAGASMPTYEPDVTEAVDAVRQPSDLEDSRNVNAQAEQDSGDASALQPQALPSELDETRHRSFGEDEEDGDPSQVQGHSSPALGQQDSAAKYAYGQVHHHSPSTFGQDGVVERYASDDEGNTGPVFNTRLAVEQNQLGEDSLENTHDQGQYEREASAEYGERLAGNSPSSPLQEGNVVETIDDIAERHTMIIKYGETDYRFFARSEDDDPNQYFLSSTSALRLSLRELLSNLREVISQEVSPLDELVMHVDGLGLEFGETMTNGGFLERYTFGDILTLYDTFVKNDVEDPPDLYTYLMVRPNCCQRMTALQDQANSGKTLTDIAVYRQCSPSGNELAISPDISVEERYDEYEGNEYQRIEEREADDLDNQEVPEPAEQDAASSVGEDEQNDEHRSIEQNGVSPSGYDQNNKENTEQDAASAIGNEEENDEPKNAEQEVASFVGNEEQHDEPNNTELKAAGSLENEEQQDDPNSAEQDTASSIGNEEQNGEPESTHAALASPVADNDTFYDENSGQLDEEHAVGNMADDGVDYDQLDLAPSQNDEVSYANPQRTTDEEAEAAEAAATASRNSSATATLTGDDKDEIDYSEDEDEDADADADADIDANAAANGDDKVPAAAERQASTETQLAAPHDDDEITWESENEDTPSERPSGTPKQAVQVSPAPVKRMPSAKRTRSDLDSNEDTGEQNDVKRRRS